MVKVEEVPLTVCPSLLQVKVKVPVLSWLQVRVVDDPWGTALRDAVMLDGLLGGSAMQTNILSY